MYFVKPHWSVPANICALTTTKPLSLSYNDLSNIKKLNLAADCIILQQQHSAQVLCASNTVKLQPGDGLYTNKPGLACAVLTADCLPILIANKPGNEVAALHAGWRGLATGIIANGIAKFEAKPPELIAWLGPAISAKAFEVGPEVREIFVKKDFANRKAFMPSARAGYWMADLYQLAAIELNQLGINAIYGGEYCTYSDSKRFYSYRRDKTTSRMVSLIYIL